MKLNSLETFIEKIKEAWGPLTSGNVSLVRELFEGLVKTPGAEDWLADLLGQPDLDKELYRDQEHGFVLLAHTEKEGLYRIPHDHGSGWVIYAVQNGEMEMKTYRPIINQDGEMNLVCRESYRVNPGECKVYLPGDIHDTRCISKSVLMFRLTSCDLRKERQEGRMVRYAEKYVS